MDKSALVIKIEYHYLFCSRYRRRVFDIKGTERCFCKALKEVCGENGWTVLDVQCDGDTVRLTIYPDCASSPDKVVKFIKKHTSEALINSIESLSKAQNVWTRNYIVSSSKISEREAAAFIKKQKRRG